MQNRLRIVSLVLLGLVWSGIADAQVREVSGYLGGDVGYATHDRQGNPVIAINPRVCRRMGPELCNFFRAHEQAHHRLGHFHRNITVQQAEAEADRWAAMNSSPQSVRAAQQFFCARRRFKSRAWIKL